MASDVRSTVLVVDDEPNLVTIVARTLRSDGYLVVTATSGAEGLALGAAHDPPIDLLITDLRMPEMSGRQLSVALRNVRRGLKVVYLTGHADELFGDLTLLEPHEAFIEKPISPPLVREAVSLHLFGTITPPSGPAAPAGSATR
jgi:CheY-like chemotaxis protein